jgi:hypothetical protein
MTLKDIVKKLRDSLPPVQAYNAIKTMATPQWQQQANNLYQGAIKATPQYQIQKALQVKTGIKPVDYATERLGAYVKNNYYQPLANLPTNIKSTFAKNTPLGERAMSAFNTAMTPLYSVPDPTDALMGILNLGKGYKASQIRGGNLKQNMESAVKSATMENYQGIGSALTKNPTAENILNLAELPIMLLAGGLRINKNTDISSITKAFKEGKINLDEAKALTENLKKIKTPTTKSEVPQTSAKKAQLPQPETQMESGVARNRSTSQPIIPSYTRGSIAETQRKIDKLIGYSDTGLYHGQEEKIRTDTLNYAKQEAPKEVVAEITKLEKIMSDIREAKAAIDQRKIKIQESQIAEVTKLKATAELERIESAFTSQFNKRIDQLKLNSKEFKITRDQIGRPKTISYTPDVERIEKLKVKSDEALKVKNEIKQSKEWEKQVFGEANARTTTKAVDDLTKQMKSSTNQGILDNADNWKDKSRLALTNETMERNFTDVMGKDAQPFKDKLIEPIFKAEANRTKFLNKERAEINALGIKPKSKESALVQELGEGKITKEEVKKLSPDADKIINAEKVLREKYNQYLTELNKVLTRNGYDPIPMRKDYFHHFQDIHGLFEEMGITGKADILPTDINGLTADFKPGRSFFNASLQRKTNITDIDAITGIDKYLDGASSQIFHTDNIQRLRAFETAIREKYAGTKHLSNFVADLTEYTNGLARKKSMLDRSSEALVGRKIYSAANRIKSQTGANMVGLNIASAATNTIPIVETLATTNKVSVGQAALGIIKNLFKDDGFIDKSNFLTNRIGSDKLSMNAWENAQKAGHWIFKTIDTFTSQFVVRSKYLEGIKKGLSEVEAMKQADNWGRKLLAGRTAGEMPTLFNSKTAGFLTQFQLEVNNQWSFMFKDIPRNFSKKGAASALGQLLVYSYIYNNIYEKAFGRRPAIDPIGVGVEAYEDYTNPDMKKGQANKNLMGNIANQLPYASVLTGGRIPIGSAIPNPLKVMSGESTLGKELLKVPTYILPPTGGGQIKKTIEGLSAYKKGASTTLKGLVRYPVVQDGVNLVRSAIAGQYASPEAIKYFREGKLPLSEKQSETLLKSDNKVGTYNLYQGQAKANAKIDDIRAQVLETGKEQTLNGKKYYLSSETNSQTGEKTPVVKSIKVSQSTSDIYGGLDKEYEKSTDAPSNVIEKVWTYGKGFIKDKEGTLNAIKTKQPVRKVRGDAVIVERLAGLSALDQGDKATEVDHIIAVALGGDNSESNLMVISKQDNRAKGIVDTYLSDLLEEGKITKKEAQSRDLNWRNEINNLSSADKNKVNAILATTPVKEETKVNTGILTTISTREYKPIYNNDTQTYSDVQIKIPEPLKLSGMTEIDKQLKSKYKSAISTAKTNIGKLYLDGQLTAKEANDAIIALNTSSGTGTKKPKKITFKVTKFKTPKITIKKKSYPKTTIKLGKKKRTKIVRRYSIK